MKKKETVFNRREFLNLPGNHSGGHIVTHIIYYNEDDWGSTDIHLSIADCVRSVDFELDNLRTKEGRKNAIHKVDTFIDVFTELKEALNEACIREKKLEKKNKK